MKLGYTWAKGQGEQEKTIPHTISSQFANIRMLSNARALIGTHSDKETTVTIHARTCSFVA